MDSEERIDTIITNLKVISTLQVNDKLKVNNGHLQIDPHTTMRSIVRWLNGDSRHVILKFIKELFKNVNILRNETPRITDEMEGVKIGLNNLKITYSFDSVVVAKIETIIQKIN